MSAPRQPGRPDRAAAPGSGAERLPRSGRIRRPGDIRILLRLGSRRGDPLLEVFSAPAALEGAPRFGVIVPRHRHTIVERNRLRRRLREVGRRELLPRLRREGCDADVLVRSRPAAYDASFGDLKAAFLRLTDPLCSDGSSSV
jgi:ribonuclease P protein component